MALTKNKETNSGATAYYHKIKSVSINTTTWSASIFVASYKDQASRQAGKHPMEAKSYKTEPNSFTALAMSTDNPVKLGYQWLKSNAAFFSDAVDA